MKKPDEIAGKIPDGQVSQVLASEASEALPRGWLETAHRVAGSESMWP
jgi:hypothetical protein